MTDIDAHDWITLHRLRFPEPVSSLERVFPPVVGPDCWLFGPHYDVGPDGMLTGVSDIWSGVGIWHSRGAAESMVAAPGDAIDAPRERSGNRRHDHVVAFGGGLSVTTMINVAIGPSRSETKNHTRRLRPLD